jgi:molecular chaperone HtpG
MDYPFNLKGILYFPKMNNQYDTLEGTIKLYNNQVFIADNIKEVIPEFLLLLKGVIDCPDLPLNVSRSALQNDGFVKKISDYISKKVADKLSGMCKTDRESYEKYWDDINPFIKYGCLKDAKFAEKMNDSIIFKDLDGKYITLKDYLESCKDKHENKVFYVSNETEQGQYINMFRKEELNAIILTHNIDSAFISNLEQKNEGVKFLRIDADLSDLFKEEVSEEELKEINEKLSELFKKELGNDKLEVRVDKLKDAEISSMITVSEENLRMQEMMKMYGMADMNMGNQGETLVLNANNSLVQFLFEHADNENSNLLCNQLYDLAVLSQRPLSTEQMTAFIERSNKLMKIIAK